MIFSEYSSGPLQSLVCILLPNGVRNCALAHRIERGRESIKRGVFFAVSPELVLHQTQMDSFTYITPTEVPADNDDGGSGGNAYCVVAQSTPVEIPSNMEGGGSGGNSYCVVA